MSKKAKPIVMAAHIVHLTAKDTIPADDSKLPLADAIELRKLRIHTVLSKFLDDNFTKQTVAENGDIQLSTTISVLVAEVPKGLASTSILFQEVQKS